MMLIILLHDQFHDECWGWLCCSASGPPSACAPPLKVFAPIGIGELVLWNVSPSSPQNCYHSFYPTLVSLCQIVGCWTAELEFGNNSTSIYHQAVHLISLQIFYPPLNARIHLTDSFSSHQKKWQNLQMRDFLYFPDDFISVHFKLAPSERTKMKQHLLSTTAVTRKLWLFPIMKNASFNNICNWKKMK